MKRPVTIGMATYNDFDGVYLTIMSALHQHGEEFDLKFVVVDNNPESEDGRANVAFCNKVGAKYVPETSRVSTGVRNRVFEEAETDFVICVDSHVQIQNGGIAALMAVADQHTDRPVILQGPLLYEGWLLDKPEMKHRHVSTHWAEEWGFHADGRPYGMYGKFAYDARFEEGKPFPIPMQGLGMFACWRKFWLGFSPLFNDFGGEEGYIHDKFRRMGGDCLCVPQAGWTHRFEKVGRKRKPHSMDQLCLNYLLGRIENQKPIEDVIEHFRGILPKGRVEEIRDQAYSEIQKRKVIK